MSGKNLLNASESQTRGYLEEVCNRCQAEIFPKVRVKDAVDIDNSGVSDEQYSYALKAHFDFVIADARTTEALFAVEFDGPTHSTRSEVKRRDQLKKGVCQHLEFPLLRINARYLHTSLDRKTPLAWLIEVWFTHRDFRLKQEQGLIPQVEVFDPSLVVKAAKDGEWFPYWPASPYRKALMDWQKKHLCIDPTPFRYEGKDSLGSTKVFAYVRTSDQSGVCVKLKMRAQNFGPWPYDLLRQMAVIQLVKDVQAVIHDDTTPSPLSMIRKRLQNFRDRVDTFGDLKNDPLA